LNTALSSHELEKEKVEGFKVSYHLIGRLPETRYRSQPSSFMIRTAFPLEPILSTLNKFDVEKILASQAYNMQSDGYTLLKELLLTDPGLPKHKPTEAYWQHIPHPLAECQSPNLRQTTDIAVIGGGITGCSVAKYLLEGRLDTTVTIFEARTLCSGATGRNGGHLVTFGAAGYSSLKRVHGAEMAVKILRFAQDTCDQVLQVARECALQESEIRTVTRVRSFGDSESFEAVKRSVAEYEVDYPECNGRFKFIDGEQAATVISFPEHQV
jgi:hypothetical protein